MTDEKQKLSHRSDLGIIEHNIMDNVQCII